MPPPLDEQETPHLHPTAQSVNFLLFLSSGSRHLLISGLSCQEKRENSGVKCAARVCEKKDICTHKLITMQMRRERV